VDSYNTVVLTIQKEIEDEIGAMQTYAGLGDVYRTLQQLDRATEHYELQLSAAQKVGKQQGIAKAFFNLSVIMAACGRHEAALAQARKALELFEEIGSKRTDEIRKQVQELTAGELDCARMTEKRATPSSGWLRVTRKTHYHILTS